MTLNARQESFCQNYALDLACKGNATQSAIAAGYSEKSAGPAGDRLLKNEKIMKRLAEIQAQQAERNQATIDNVVAEYSLIAFSDITEFFTFTDGRLLVKDPAALPENVRRAIAKISPVQTKNQGVLYQISLHDKVKALDSLGRYLGMFGEFNLAIKTLETYGIKIKKDGDRWVVVGEDFAAPTT